MSTSSSTPANGLISELLAYGGSYSKAKKVSTEKQPFLAYSRDSGKIEVTAKKSLKAVAEDAASSYIVAPNNPIASFSMIKRKLLPNKLGDLKGSALRQALGTILDNA